ncbi:hypothetical protein M427DRAFT_237357 [Gonapodya prolifera JEL478]|uniref:Uncharacterized protein n=1 Tax=Gonapodya prolifera (strain JEL478) TaxID=1344416 RepID=A0A139AML9_GONPJ|nr:hypothetical protein M427DRAFT_237357 [Gonapodya prolifera JEL478]|eukprot:KXS18017.1 hypothetical protein M427DRAFT_237357 [Gonapodya prolifera JEL478]
MHFPSSCRFTITVNRGRMATTSQLHSGDLSESFNGDEVMQQVGDNNELPDILAAADLDPGAEMLHYFAVRARQGIATDVAGDIDMAGSGSDVPEPSDDKTFATGRSVGLSSAQRTLGPYGARLRSAMRKASERAVVETGEGAPTGLLTLRAKF